MSRSGAAFLMRVGNGSLSTSSIYSQTALYGTGSAAGSDRITNGDAINVFNNLGFTSTVGANNLFFHFMNYSNTTTYKSILARGNNPAGTAYPGTLASVSLWRSTSAINIISLYRQSTDTFLSGSTFTLYGIKAA